MASRKAANSAMDVIDQYTLSKQPDNSEWAVSQEEMTAFEEELAESGFNYTDHL